MENLKMFECEEFGQLSVITKDDYPWFVAKEVCKVLGISNSSDAVSSLDDDEKDDIGLTDTIGREQKTNIINESGLYSLIFRSVKPEAKKFKKWVTSEVLPDIRKHGIYAPKDAVEFMCANPDQAIQMLQKYKFEKEEKELAIKQRDEAIATKAWISDKKTATAMATASVKSRECSRLNEALGQGKNWKCVKAIPWLLDEFIPSRGMYSIVGKNLKRLSGELDIEVRKVDNEDYGTINAYHIDVIEEFRRILDDDYDFLDRYRVENF